MENWSWKQPDNINNGDSFIKCNFSQFAPDTDIFEGKTGLSFIDCNLVNCKLPDDVGCDNCNTSQNIYEVVEEV